MAAPPDDMLWARGLHYAYDGSPALQGVSIGVKEGEVVALTGPRGSGKTTLLRCLSGQLLPEQGEVWFNSSPVHTLARAARERLRLRRFGWIDSSPRLVPELTAWENAALPLLLHGSGYRSARGTARAWLERLDVGDCAGKRPAALHQAQRQRVAVARALVHSPDVVFADEPTAPLHQGDRAQVLRALSAAARSHGITVLLATHDFALDQSARTADATGAALADRIVTLTDGRRARTPTTGGAAGPSAGPEGSAACSLSV
ncbi:ATP-binding cassette domain-containing protein [Streptomyces oryzae]|uniref:ATP-binding cassette domain-containing protein n=1 Tax=Streptomyces oryzae TaxID=1434886 RepID=A0ABS3XIL2_9ACTN|nr:ATP-binding cassette domain-containing protein [Streptomyces oryzae]MBO8195175.1 ATP-binding cassette domain-containing protein [Streptomyces oryzae]